MGRLNSPRFTQQSAPRYTSPRKRGESARRAGEERASDGDRTSTFPSPLTAQATALGALYSSSIPARDFLYLSTIWACTLGGTGSCDLKSIVNEPWPPVMLLSCEA